MILVTGGTGLVGSHLLVRLAQENEPIRAIYRTLESIEKTKKVFSYYTNITKDLFAKHRMGTGRHYRCTLNDTSF